MTNYLRVDAVNRQLVMDKTFAKNAQIVGSAEYDSLKKMKRTRRMNKAILKRRNKRLNHLNWNGRLFDSSLRILQHNNKQ